jgi:hypothetical protein
MKLLHKELTGKILGAAMEVHRELGCGYFLVLSQTQGMDFTGLQNPRNPRFQKRA